jgi:hypothetical protein
MNHSHRVASRQALIEDGGFHVKENEIEGA